MVINNSKQRHLVIGAAVLSVTAALIAFFIYNRPEESTSQLSKVENIAETTKAPTPKKEYILPLNGEIVTDSDRLSSPVNSFVISNSPEARPQSGLIEADMVYEFSAEAGVTRFVAMYQGDLPETIGPLRSLRPYFSDVALAHDANISHVGGAPDALAEVNSIGLRSLNEFTYGSYYYRSTDRYAPHNLYAKGESIDELNEDLGLTSSTANPWKRSADSTSSSEAAESISLNFTSYKYNSSYKYNEATGQYARSQGGEQHLDKESGDVIAPEVVIVIKAAHSVVSSVGHLSVGLVGSGDATVFQNGKVIEGKWSKPSRQGAFVFTDNLGSEISLKPGFTWLSVVPTDASVSYF